ncbi:MAG: FAD:protein FMN transferase [Prevotellaceae bacterium]|jgi:thiamine biosynthesis lipoprotein|nr:FAD:protein FMN transferase [Prevotellaceae bacterium]
MKRIKLINLSLLIVIAFFSCKKNENPALKKMYFEGAIQGTTYHISYLDSAGRDFHREILDTLHAFDRSLSLFDSMSVISRINRNDSTVRTDSLFRSVFRTAQEVSKKTYGYFDMTVGPLVRLWGFNNAKRITVTPRMIDSLRPYTGYQKVWLQGDRLIKYYPAIQLDANAIAQGYSCDLIGELLERKGIVNYLVEIGGEIATKGHNPQNSAWSVAISRPVDDSTSTINEIQQVIRVENCGLATSGNYRKFYMHNGQKFGHAINPFTGCPVTHNLLSVTVIAPTAIEADAYATAFMVMGISKSFELLKNLPKLEAYFIYRDKDNKMQVLYTRGFEKMLAK